MRPADARPCAKCQRRPRVTWSRFCRRCARDVRQAQKVRARIKGHAGFAWRKQA